MPDSDNERSPWNVLRALSDLVLDFSFREFVTPRLIRVLCAISFVSALLAALAWMFSGFSVGLLYGLFTLITGPLAFVLYVLAARVAVELILAVFIIAERARRE